MKTKTVENVHVNFILMNGSDSWGKRTEYRIRTVILENKYNMSR